MGLAIEVLPSDPWVWAAVRRLEARDPDGAAIFRRGGEGLTWEIQQGCDFCLTLESLIRHWEAMDPGNPARPRDTKRDTATAAQARRIIYAQFFRAFQWFEVNTPRDGRFLISGTNLRLIDRVLCNLRGDVHQVRPADAFDRAYAVGAIWWAF
jgi:hypothetical protein